MSLGLGDIIAAGTLAADLYQLLQTGRRGAPALYQTLESNIGNLEIALKQLKITTETTNLGANGKTQLSFLIESFQGTLDLVQSFLAKYSLVPERKSTSASRSSPYLLSTVSRLKVNACTAVQRISFGSKKDEEIADLTDRVHRDTDAIQLFVLSAILSCVSKSENQEKAHKGIFEAMEKKLEENGKTIESLIRQLRQARPHGQLDFLFCQPSPSMSSASMPNGDACGKASEEQGVPSQMTPESAGTGIRRPQALDSRSDEHWGFANTIAPSYQTLNESRRIKERGLGEMSREPVVFLLEALKRYLGSDCTRREKQRELMAILTQLNGGLRRLNSEQQANTISLLQSEGVGQTLRVLKENTRSVMIKREIDICLDKLASGV